MNLLLTSSSIDEDNELGPAHTAIPVEVEKYHKEHKSYGTSEDSLKWSQKLGDYPSIIKVVSTYMCCPPSSEQLFSGAGNIYDEKRKRLHADKVEKLLFLKSNLTLLKFKYSISVQCSVWSWDVRFIVM